MIKVGKLWVPYIIFSNTDDDDAISIQSARTVLFVSRMGNFTRTGPEIADEVSVVAVQKYFNSCVTIDRDI